MAEQRMPTGVPGFDEISHGGLLPGRSYLVVGAAGTGKTMFSLQWLMEGLRQNERCLYITLAEPADEIMRNAGITGWNLDALTLIDLSPATQSIDSFEDEYHIFPPSEVERVSIWQSLFHALQDAQPQRVMIDSMTQLRYLATDEYQFRKHILRLIHFLHQARTTALLAFEPTELDRETSVALAVDGIIRLTRDISPMLAIGLRSIQVEKMRGSDFLSGLHPFRIGSHGLEIYPHRVEETGNPEPGQHMVSSGIARLDELLGGGVESGTITMITGPTGVGKSTLGMQFLAHQATSGKRAIMFSFEEPPSYLIKRSRQIGRPIEHLLEQGTLTIVRINPLELYPDQFLGLVRDAVERDGYQMMMIDSLRGYKIAMQEFGTPEAHIHNLAMYLTRHEVTALLINEVGVIAGADIRVTDMGVSYLADNLLLLRYMEYAGHVIKVIGCLKKRLGAFQTELRQLDITDQGIEIGEMLPHLRGILTGTPSGEVQTTDEP